MQVATASQLVKDLSREELTVENVLSHHLEHSPSLVAALQNQSMSALARSLEGFVRLQQMQAGTVLFERGAPGDSVFIVLSGSVASVLDLVASDEEDAAACKRSDRCDTAACAPPGAET